MKKNYFNKDSRVVKHVCKDCGHVEFRSNGGAFKHTLLTLVLFVGFLTVVASLIVGPNTLVATYSSSALYLLAGQGSDFDARSYALNHTSFDGSDSYLFAKDLLATMPHVRYVHSSYFSPIPSYEDILVEGADCKAVSTLFSKMMLEVGYSSRIDCSYPNHHCVTRVEYRGFDPKYKYTYLIVDLTIESYEVYNLWDDHWDESVSPVESRSYRGKV